MTPVQVGELSSEVVAEPEAAAPGATAPEQQAPWEAEAQARAVHAQLAGDRARTRAGGFDA